MGQIGDDSKLALQQLQAQLEDYKEKSRREVADAQRQAKEWASEAEKNSGGLSRLQDEVGAQVAGGWDPSQYPWFEGHCLLTYGPGILGP